VRHYRHKFGGGAHQGFDRGWQLTGAGRLSVGGVARLIGLHLRNDGSRGVVSGGQSL
jgi:hypothetical protein